MEQALSRVALLDVNVLVALFDPDHVHHDLAHDWFAEHRASGWATCPLTENGLIRVLSNHAYGLNGQRPADLLEMLRAFRASGHHVFWPDAVSLADEGLFVPALLAAHRHVTDAYLLGLATRMRGCLATFDRGIPVKAVAGATTNELQVIAPAE